jgi:anhydro-N-acetylmuramic acid kinase
MDLAMGGQGAPLATFFHKTVFGDSSKIVAVNNLGGISNVTYLGKNKTLSFDTGPANILMDYAIAKISHGKKQRDENGMVAARGIPKTALINSWLSHSFFGKKPPKSTGREEFGREYFEKTWQALKKSKASDEDCMATYCEFTAKSIALNYARHLPRFPEQVVLSGGGAENPTLVKFIRRSLREAQWSLDKNIKTPVEVVTSASLGWPSQSIEASAFALLAYQTINGRPGNLPETTGASRAAILGQISPAP